MTIVLLWLLPKYVPIPYMLNLLIIVTAILYSSCHYSLPLRTDQAMARGMVDPTLSPDEQRTTKKVVTESLGKEDAQWFPIMGSISLFGLYCAFKFLDEKWVNWILSGYFGMIGCGAITVTLSSVLGSILPTMASMGIHKEYKVSHPLPSFLAGSSPWELELDISLADVLSFVLATGITGVYLQHKAWIFNNVLGICFCIQGIQSFSLGTFKIGAILLTGLFFYDIFWVYVYELTF